MKKCTRCKVAKPLAEFSKHHKSGDGRQPWCKECCSTHRRTRLQEPEYREQRNSEIREYHRANLMSRLRNKMRGLIRRVSPDAKKFKPVSAFLQEGITDPKVINALSNLRPLWAKDNFAKGGK